MFKKYRNYLVVGGVNLVMIGYIILLILVLLGKIGTGDDWAVANYCTLNIDCHILDEHSSIIHTDRYYYEYQHEEENYSYEEDIIFSSNSSASIGGYGFDDTYLFRGKDEIEISFTLNNASIYKLEFSEIRVSSVEDKQSSKALSPSEYKLDKSNNIYTLKYVSSGDIYIYNVSILYLVKK